MLCLLAAKGPQMPRTKTQSTKIVNRRNRTRETLIQVATRQFAASGPDDVSIENIIEESEIARTTFYTFYPSKEALLTDIVRPVFERGIEEFRLIDAKEPRQIARGIANVYLTLWRENRDAFQLAKRMGMKHFPLFEDLHQDYSNMLRKILGVLQQSGRLRNNNAAYTSQLIARSVVLFLEVYSQDDNFENLFRTTMEGLLLKCRK